MTVVKRIAADLGVTIAATVHSPSSYCYGLFDAVMVLVSGRTAYWGHPQQQCIEFFAGVLRVRPLRMGENIAEYVMDYLTLADLEGRAKQLAGVSMDGVWKVDAVGQINLRWQTWKVMQSLQVRARTGYVT